MSARGVFAVARGIWDHPLLDDGRAPFSRREAWIWLISEAAWRPHARHVARRRVAVARGQVAHSTRFMARAWRWPEAKVRRFIARLQSDAMIDAATDAGVTLLTICNYEKWQFGGAPTDAPFDAATDAPLTHERRRREERGRRQERIKDSRAVARATRTEPERFDEFWLAYPRRAGANPRWPAAKAFAAFAAGGTDPGAIIDGARRYAEEIRGHGKERTQYVTQALVWLSQRRWQDYPAPSAEPATGAVPAGKFYAAAESAPLAAWDRHMRATRGRGLPRDRDGGWWVEAEWPPGDGAIPPAATGEFAGHAVPGRDPGVT